MTGLRSPSPEPSAGPSRRPVPPLAISRLTLPRAPNFSKKREPRVREAVPSAQPASRTALNTPASLARRSMARGATASATRQAERSLPGALQPLKATNSNGADSRSAPLALNRKTPITKPIPDFAKAHALAEERRRTALLRARRPTIPETGRTPGKTSRMRVAERTYSNKAKEERADETSSSSARNPSTKAS